MLIFAYMLLQYGEIVYNEKHIKNNYNYIHRSNKNEEVYEENTE